MSEKFLLSGLIKFGKKKHMERLLNNGEICMNRLSYYRNHYNQEIGDKTEGTIYSMPASEVKTYINGKYIHNDATTGSLKISTPEQDPFLYCMYGEYIKVANEWKSEIKVDNRVFDFGNAAVIINDPIIFIERIIRENNSILTGKVKYINENEYTGKMGYFAKYNKYKHQQEFRMVYFNEEIKEERIIFNIGSIKDIARIEYL